MSDRYLAGLVRAVEDGATSPALWMCLDSGDLAIGTPVPRASSSTELSKRSCGAPRGRRESVRSASQSSKGVRGLGRHTRGCDRLLGGRSGRRPDPLRPVGAEPRRSLVDHGGKELKGSTPTFFGVAVTV